LSVYDEIPTILVKIERMGLYKEEGAWDQDKESKDDAQALLDGKRVRLSEMSVQLMPSQFSREEEHIPHSHPSTILLWKSRHCGKPNDHHALDVAIAY